MADESYNMYGTANKNLSGTFVRPVKTYIVEFDYARAYELKGAALEADDTFKLMPLKEVLVLSAHAYVAEATDQGSTTIDIGHTGDTDAFVDGGDPSSVAWLTDTSVSTESLAAVELFTADDVYLEAVVKTVGGTAPQTGKVNIVLTVVDLKTIDGPRNAFEPGAND